MFNMSYIIPDILAGWVTIGTGDNPQCMTGLWALGFVYIDRIYSILNFRYFWVYYFTIFYHDNFVAFLISKRG
jgi:hypothetical protein